MSNGVVLFFANDSHGWWVKDMYTVAHGFRGFCPDGCFWIDYFTETNTINICIGRSGGIDWDKPINSIKNKVLVETIPVTINSSQYLEIQKWAKEQRT